MREKRNRIRYPSKLLTTTILGLDEGQIPAKEAFYSEDISVDGLRLIIPQQLVRRAKINLNLFLFSDPVPVNIQGKIVWAEKMIEQRAVHRADEDNANGAYCRAGIQLINTGPFERERILRWIGNETAAVNT
jgi:hypothetical protein